MGSNCCAKISIPSQPLNKESSQKKGKQSLYGVEAYYNLHKKFMRQKLKTVFKEIVKKGNFNSEILNLSFVFINKQESDYFSRLMPYVLHIKVLNLWKTGLGNGGLQLIGSQISRLSELEILSLEDNNLGANNCEDLARILLRLNKIKEIWLQINDIGMKGALILANSFPHLKLLKKIGLDENNIESSGALKIASSLRHLNKLEFIGLNYNMITKETCVLIAKILKHLQINSLSVIGNDIDEETISNISAILPNTIITF